jgi:hypothetical protein
MASLPGGAHDLADETLGSGCTAPAVANAAWTNAKIVFPLAHDGFTKGARRPTALDALIRLGFR